MALVAIGISVLVFWFNYQASLPALTAKVELIKPLIPGEEVHFKIDIDNTGNTIAKHLHPDLRIKFATAEVPFKAFDGVPNINLVSPNWRPTVSDLGPKGHTTIYSMSKFNLQNDESVKAVIAGTWNFYVYGRIPYQDVLHMSHEFHFCSSYTQLPGGDPLKFALCHYYNETE
jgi:hypothetical protein